MSFGGIIVLVLFLIQNDQNGNEIIPVLSLYALAGYRLLPAIQNVYSARSMIKYNYPAFKIIVDDLDDISTASLSKKNDTEESKEIDFNENFIIKGLKFKYKESNQETLKLLDLEIKKNEAVGFVGLTGSGKTTLIDVILGLLKGEEGKITVDGVEIGPENRQSWQSKIGYVPQHIF